MTNTALIQTSPLSSLFLYLPPTLRLLFNRLIHLVRGSFSHALATLTTFGSCLLPLQTRLLILFTDGGLKTLRQKVFRLIQTILTQMLSKQRSTAKAQIQEQPDNHSYVHFNPS